MEGSADRAVLGKTLKGQLNDDLVEEHIYASERKGEMIYRLVDPQTMQETYIEPSRCARVSCSALSQHAGSLLCKHLLG